MFDANCLYHFRWRKKKSNSFIISSEFFEQAGILQHKTATVDYVSKNQSEEKSGLSNKVFDATTSTNFVAENSFTDIATAENLPRKEVDSLVEAENITKLSSSTSTNNISAFSLSGVKAKKILQEQSKPAQFSTENLPINEFNETQMRLYWNEYANNLGNSGQKIMESLLTISAPSLNDNRITLELPNQGSKLDFDAETPPLLRFLQQKLNNFSIKIEVVVNEQVEKKFAFTPEDRYERLRKINPNIELLRKMFELDFN